MSSIKKSSVLFFVLLFLASNAFAKVLHVGQNKSFTTIKEALLAAKNGDTIIVYKGIYREGNIVIDNTVCLLGKDNPILDGEMKYEVITIKSDNVTIKGFHIKNSSPKALKELCGIRVYHTKDIVIEDNTFFNNFFSIYLQSSRSCLIKNNTISSKKQMQQQSGNGIHCWKSDSLQIIGNKIDGHRDGIYFEFVTNSIIWRNISKQNLRYGLHFMFSSNNAYIGNYFKNNGSGIAVMFSKKVTMLNNTFEANWGDAAYGLLFKELTDCYLSGNRFIDNTTGIFFDGTSRIVVEHNLFKSNGWGLRIQANCIDNTIAYNNFIGNTFDVSTNGSLTLNFFNENYWDKCEAYDLNKDNIGDIVYHPLSLNSVIVEKSPPAMLLYRSFIVSLLDKSEKILPSLTPENFVDKRPRIKPYNL